jgi:hypothetical protein
MEANKTFEYLRITSQPIKRSYPGYSSQSGLGVRPRSGFSDQDTYITKDDLQRDVHQAIRHPNIECKVKDGPDRGNGTVLNRMYCRDAKSHVCEDRG